MAEFARVLDVLERRAAQGAGDRLRQAGRLHRRRGHRGIHAAGFGARRAHAGRSGWLLFNRLAAVSYPTLALMRGHCMGGGLELALPAAVIASSSTSPAPSSWRCRRSCSASSPAGAACCACRADRPGGGPRPDADRQGRRREEGEAPRPSLTRRVPPRVMELTRARMLVRQARPRQPRRLPFIRWAMNGPLRKIVAARLKQVRQGPAAKALPGALRDRRHLGEITAATR